MTQNVSYHITYVEIFTMDRKLNILSQASGESQIFHESSFSCSVVMCGLSLQLSEYGAYDFANNASKVSVLPPCLPPCHPPLPPLNPSSFLLSTPPSSSSSPPPYLWLSNSSTMFLYPELRLLHQQLQFLEVLPNLR